MGLLTSFVLCTALPSVIVSFHIHVASYGMVEDINLDAEWIYVFHHCGWRRKTCRVDAHEFHSAPPIRQIQPVSEYSKLLPFLFFRIQQKNTHVILHQDRGFLILNVLGIECFDVLELWMLVAEWSLASITECLYTLFLPYLYKRYPSSLLDVKPNCYNFSTKIHQISVLIDYTHLQMVNSL